MRDADVFSLCAVDCISQDPAYAVSLLLNHEIGSVPPVAQCEYIPLRQYSQLAHEQMQEINTCSPFLNPRTELPISSMMPTPSCPNIVPGVHVATSPLLICRSVPQMVDFVSLTIASVG